MGVSLDDTVLDALLLKIADNGNELNVNNAEPTTHLEAITTFKLADVALTTGIAGADYATANGDTDGRKLTISEKATITIDTTGTATHISITDNVGSILLAVIALTSSVALVATNTVTVPAFDIVVRDPT